jgi:hypothetical protein
MQKADRDAEAALERQREDAFVKEIEDSKQRVQQQLDAEAAERQRVAAEEAAAEAERQRIAAQEAAQRAAAAKEAERQRLAAEEAERQRIAAQEAAQRAAAENAARQQAAAALSGPASQLQSGIGVLDQKLAEARNLLASRDPAVYDTTELTQQIGFLEKARSDASNALSGLGSTASAVGGEVLGILSNANVLPPQAVDAVFNKVLDTVGVDSLPTLLGPEGTQRILEAAGVAGDVLNSGIPVVGILSDVISGSTFGETAANAAKAYAIATVAAIPGIGPAIAAAVALDSVLSSLLGYRSPINEVVGAVAQNVDKAVSWVDRQVTRPVVQAAARAVTLPSNLNDPGQAILRAVTIPRSIRRRFRFQEGGLVDLGEDSMYNGYDFYGGLTDLPLSAMPIEPAQPVLGFAGGGVIPLVGGGKIAVGPGGGLDDLIPTSINGRRVAALSDGEFVVPADVVSMMGDGSSNAGARRLYDLVKQIREAKTGTSQQAGPLPVGKILERTMR